MIDRCQAAGGQKNDDDDRPLEVTDFGTGAEYQCDLLFDDEELQDNSCIFVKLQEFQVSCVIFTDLQRTTTDN